jgi:hypothetical protein
MITLAKDCLLFRLSNGETVPFSADMISVELTGETAYWFDPETASHAAQAVFHYFKSELGRQSVSAEEFAAAMEKALRGVDRLAWSHQSAKSQNVIESDLRRLAHEAGEGGELLFFPRLRDQLREHMSQKPRVLRYHGLRACVKQISGARRWTIRCQDLEEQIVSFLRRCAGVEPAPCELALVVE